MGSVQNSVDFGHQFHPDRVRKKQVSSECSMAILQDSCEGSTALLKGSPCPVVDLQKGVLPGRPPDKFPRGSATPQLTTQQGSLWLTSRQGSQWVRRLSMLPASKAVISATAGLQGFFFRFFRRRPARFLHLHCGPSS
ncbi:hypothetical protein CHARACLAT_032963 [Characodon lateralis]|uniref:Uncharacterized protein n=1 Tax=Characodon lateralis TaxID=208331 RepID=A0ABU7F8C9_9TELE|nr:hypothetical protein [Characodon lateralis]